MKRSRISVTVIRIIRKNILKIFGDTEYFKKGLRAISEAPLYEVSLKNGQPKEGIKELAEFLRKKYENM